MNPFNPGSPEYDEWERQENASGASLLNNVRTALARYVVLPSKDAEVAVTLWIAATHAANAMWHFPRLSIRSPEKRCGKTRLLDMINALARNPLATANVSSAVLYRVMGGDDPHTLLIDEADVIWGTRKAADDNEPLRGLVNAGFERGRPTLRWDVASRKMEKLETFGFVALAGIGVLPDTITDRSINITMRRRAAGEKVSPFRSRRDGEPLARLAEQIHDWLITRTEEISKAEPEMPVEDRAADVWESLIIIADLAGGEWPGLARQAAVNLTREHDQEDTEANDAVKLLADIKTVFIGSTFMSSNDLALRLRQLDDAPWKEIDLTPTKLAARLSNYKIRPGRNTTGSARGYRIADFSDAFKRYLTLNPSDDEQGVSTSTREFDTLTSSDAFRQKLDLHEDQQVSGAEVSEAVKPSNSQANPLTGEIPLTPQPVRTLCMVAGCTQPGRRYPVGIRCESHI